MLRTLFKSDLPQVLSIEKSVHVVPWTEDTFLTCFDSGYLGWVIELNKKIIGFIIISLRTDECHVLNIGVMRENQRQGYGQQLLSHALNHAKKERAGIVFLEVRRSNLVAISLYRKLQFHLIGERKDYYLTVSGAEDALIFAKSLHEEKV